MIGTPVFAGFIMLVALLLLVGVRRGGHWYTNVSATLITLSFCFVVWGSLNSYRGWPIHAGLPKDSIFVAGIIDEPSSVDGDPGHIDVWLIPVSNRHQLLGYRSSKGEPRAYREPFSVQLELAVLRAETLQQGSGQPVAFSRRRRTGKPSRNHGNIARKTPKWAWRAYRLPPVSQSLKGAR